MNEASDEEDTLPQAMRSYTEAQAHLEAARWMAYEAIREAAAAGMSMREIAKRVDMSHQRVAQILKEAD
jgi:hypothetical protein